MCLKYSPFIVDLLEAKAWKKSELAERLREKFPEANVTNEQVYEFLEGKNQPRAGFAKMVEWALEINLHPRYYGVGDPKKP